MARRRSQGAYGMRRRSLGAGLLLVDLLSFASVGSAASTEAVDERVEDEERLVTARLLFAEGKENMERGDWDGAVDRFVAAARIKDTPGLRYHVAVCEERAGRLLRARAQYEAVQRLLAIRPAPDVEDLLGPALESLDQKIPRLRIILSAAAQPELVAVDGVALPDWSEAVAIPLDPGEHHVRVDVPGHVSFSTRLTLEEGEHRTLPVELEESPRFTVAREEDTSGRRWRTPLLVAGAALGATGLGIGVWGWFDRNAARDELDWAQAGLARVAVSPDACGDASGGLRRVCEDRDRALRRRDRATTAIAGGLVVFGTGAALTAASLFLFPESPARLEVKASQNEGGLYLGGVF